MSKVNEGNFHNNNLVKLLILLKPSIYAFSGGGGNFVLSTSFVGYTSVYGGVAPMVDDGYGCFYHIEQNQLVF